MIAKLRAIAAYIETRLSERSFWSDMIAAIISAAALPKPWCYYVAAAAMVKSLVPDAAKPA